MIKTKKCRCGRSTHGTVKKTCSFYLYAQFGKPTFQTVELKTRIRLYNELIKYPECYYANKENTSSDQAEDLLNNEATEPEVTEDLDNDFDRNSDVESEYEEDLINHNNVIPPQAYALFEDEIEADSSDDEDNICDDQPFLEEVRLTTDTEFNAVLEKLIEEADSMSLQEGNSIEGDKNEYDLPADELPMKSRYRTVLGDLFHFMDRAKLPMHHEYKALYFCSLCAVMFIMNKTDAEDVKQVLKSKPGTSWEKKFAFNFGYLLKRIQR